MTTRQLKTLAQLVNKGMMAPADKRYKRPLEDLRKRGFAKLHNSADGVYMPTAEGAQELSRRMAMRNKRLGITTN